MNSGDFKMHKYIKISKSIFFTITILSLHSICSESNNNNNNNKTFFFTTGSATKLKGKIKKRLNSWHIFALIQRWSRSSVSGFSPDCADHYFICKYLEQLKCLFPPLPKFVLLIVSFKINPRRIDSKYLVVFSLRP